MSVRLSLSASDRGAFPAPTLLRRRYRPYRRRSINKVVAVSVVIGGVIIAFGVLSLIFFRRVATRLVVC